MQMNMGCRPEIFLENNTHSIVDLTDSLAVYNLFATLDASLNTDASGISIIGGFIEASTYITEQSLETTIDMLSEVMGVTGNVTVGDRNSLYTQIQAIQASILFENSTGAVSIVDTDNLSNAAQSNTVDGYAYRYALVNLTPFAITGNAGLYLSSEWDADNFTQEYLNDRAHMLDQLQRRNIQDASIIPTTDGTLEYYEDRASDTVAATFLMLGGGLEGATQYVFGGDGVDAIGGGDPG
jgi:hypothetical protein